MDNVRRGFETHARDLFELLRDERDFDLILIKGSGIRRADEKVVFNLHRDSFINRLLCRFVGGRWKYYIEFVSFAFGLLPLLFFDRFHAFYVLEGPVYKFLRRWRRLSARQYSLIHCTGGWFDPGAPARVLMSRPGHTIPPTDHDYLHHVNPCYLLIAEEHGFRPENQFLIPHFIDTTQITVTRKRATSEEMRSALQIPPGMPVVLSVGSIDTEHKRMDYIIRECAAIRRPVFVLLVGQQGDGTAQIRQLAADELGPQRFAILSVPRQAIFDYYAVADVFVLASLRESFGIVFLEALACGVPVITHDYDVSRYVLGEQGYFADLSKPGELTGALEKLLTKSQTADARRSRIEYVRQRYDAQMVKESYRRMFVQVCDAH